MQEARQQESTSQEPKLTLIQGNTKTEKPTLTSSAVTYLFTKVTNGISRVIRFVEVYSEDSRD